MLAQPAQRPPPEEWLGAAITSLAPVPPVLPARLGLLLAVPRARRCLLVLDNLETVLEPGERTARYRAGYAGYGEVLRQLGESRHQSCLLLTGREAMCASPTLRSSVRRMLLAFSPRLYQESVSLGRNSSETV